MQSAYLKVPSGEAYIEYFGKGETLLCIAGGPGCTIEALKPYLLFLKKKLRIVFIDFVGVGKSKSYSDEYSRSSVIEQIDEVAKFFKCKLSLLGHSYGGLIAQDYMIQRPGNVNRTILICSNTGLPRIEKLGNRYKGLINEKERKRISNVPQKIKGTKYDYAFKFYSGLWKRYYKNRPNLIKILGLGKEYSCNPKFPFEIEQDYNNLDLQDKFKTNEIPTYIIESKTDYVWAEGKPGELIKNHPNAKSWIFENSRHHPFYEEKNKFREIIISISDSAF